MINPLTASAKQLLLGASAALLLGACTTTTTTQEASAPDATASSVEEEGAEEAEEKKGIYGSRFSDKQRCEYMARPGTRIKTRQCKTEREWEIIEQAGRDTAEEIQRRPIPINEGG